jgi:hypothetical protein
MKKNQAGRNIGAPYGPGSLPFYFLANFHVDLKLIMAVD